MGSPPRCVPPTLWKRKDLQVIDLVQGTCRTKIKVLNDGHTTRGLDGKYDSAPQAGDVWGCGGTRRIFKAVSMGKLLWKRQNSSSGQITEGEVRGGILSLHIPEFRAPRHMGLHFLMPGVIMAMLAEYGLWS